MTTLQSWIIHRAQTVKLAWPKGVADAAGVPRASLDSIATTGNLRHVGRSARGYIARALKVSVRELEALADGQIHWIDDERKVNLDRLAPASIGAKDTPKPEAIMCPAGLGIPILGRILSCGKVEQFDDWTSEDGPRLPIRYPKLPDAFALELTLGVCFYLAGECLAFHPILPAELEPGALVLLSHTGGEGESELFTVSPFANDSSCVMRSVAGGRVETTIDVSDILRAARVLGSWKQTAIEREQ